MSIGQLILRPCGVVSGDDSRVNIFELREDCSILLQKIVREIFSLEVTKHAIAQIFDGLPIKDDYFGPPDAYGYCIADPKIASRDAPTSEAVIFASKFSSALDVQSVSITAKTAARLQQTTSEHSLFTLPTTLRFLEASSSIFHDIISTIFRELHPDAGENESSQSICYWGLDHRCYTYGANYKNGMGSAAAYWAETIVFGGPVMFSRGKDGQQCNAAFIHPREGDIARLADHQVLQYMNGAQESAQEALSLSSILPFVAAPDAQRLTIREAMDEEIYREPGQIDYQWGDGKKYGFIPRECGFRRSSGTSPSE